MPSNFLSWFSRKDDPDTQSPPKTPNPRDNQTIPDAKWTLLRTRHYDDTLGRLSSVPDYHLVFALGAASGAGAILAWRRWGMRLQTAEWVTPNELARRRWVRGVVTSVRDGDDFRLYHTPGFGWRWPLKIRSIPTRKRDLKDQTIHVRIAGVDAPEGAHYGRPGQPHAEDSLAWLKNRIRGKILYCQLIRKDQYGRVVGIPLVPRPFMPLLLGKYFGSPLALEMLRAGSATTYGESGGEYGPWGRDRYLRVEEEARAARRGMWKNGVNIEKPGEYKKRYAVALGGKDEVSESGSEKDDEREEKKLLSRLKTMLRK